MEVLFKDSEKQIGQFVAEDFRTAAVFNKYGIDFCCKGDRTLDEVCEKRGIESQHAFRRSSNCFKLNNQSIHGL